MGTDDAVLTAGAPAGLPMLPTGRLTAVGVDGCRGGWVAARLELAGGRIRAVTWTAATDLTALLGAEPAGVDMPLGLPDGPGGRACDRLTRAALRPHGARVFPAPARAVLGAGSYQDACARSVRASSRSLSLQSWHLVPKIEQFDRWWGHRETARERACEVHPELLFALLAGGPVISKHTAAGRAARVALLTAVGCQVPDWNRPAGVPLGDCLDAVAAGLAAARWMTGLAQLLPAGPAPRDGAGRPMQIAG